MSRTDYRSRPPIDPNIACPPRELSAAQDKEARMNLGILFWFYKDLDVCRNRLQLLRRYNPDAPIFGLYGGNKDEAELFKSHLAPYLDDFSSVLSERDAEWKWLNGDLIITEWYRQVGWSLSWDTIIVAQWDMLILGPVAKVFAELREGEILLSGLRKVEEVFDWWRWVKQDEQRYLEFVDYIHNEFDYSDSLWCCQFVVACLPRRFFERYVNVKEPELGFIEYRVPTYARIFGVPFSNSKYIKCWWPTEPAAGDVPVRNRTITAAGQPISFKTIGYHLAQPNGSRIFHPVGKAFPAGARSARDLLVKRARRYLKQLKSLINR